MRAAGGRVSVLALWGRVCDGAGLGGGGGRKGLWRPRRGIGDLGRPGVRRDTRRGAGAEAARAETRGKARAVDSPWGRALTGGPARRGGPRRGDGVPRTSAGGPGGGRPGGRRVGLNFARGRSGGGEKKGRERRGRGGPWLGGCRAREGQGGL